MGFSIVPRQDSDQRSPAASAVRRQQGSKPQGRILFVITSFDRGARLGAGYRDVDKLDYVLMMLDEMREACEVRAADRDTDPGRASNLFLSSRIEPILQEPSPVNSRG